jgi:DNA-binding IclR family transcriptional regulator
MRLVKGLLERCVEVTELLAGSSGPCRLSDIAQALDLPKSAAHRLLRELCAQGWAAQDGADGPYRLTLRFGLLGHRVLQATGLVDLTQPLLQLLADRTHELARLTVVTGQETTGSGLVWLGSAQGAPPGLVYQPAMDGAPVLHATANGKAFLATLDDPAALRLARDGGLGSRRPTPHTLADDAALLADLAKVRARGYAQADQEAELGVTAVAVAIRCTDGPAVGTVSVAGPSLRLPARRIGQLVAALHETASALAAVWPTRIREQETMHA